jgi:hypothetical protein
VFSIECFFYFGLSRLIRAFIIGFIISYIRCKYYSKVNELLNNFVKNKRLRLIIVTLVVVFLGIAVRDCFGGSLNLIGSVYCDGFDDVTISDGKDNNNSKGDDNHYTFSISNNLINDGFDSVFRILSDNLPELIGGLGGAKIGVSLVKAATNLPPLQRGLLGVATGGLGALSIGLSGTAVRVVRKNTELGSEDSVTINIPKASFEELVKGGGIGEKEFATKTARKIVDFNFSNKTKFGTTSESGISSAFGITPVTGSEASTSSVGKTTEALKKVKVD